tara:strand:+ start:512 stop:793 length:282 start_codon:yes stop_codon:yes gene_type:complete
MSQLAKEKTEIPCPGGGREIKTTYGDLAKKSYLKSNKGHEYKFKYGDQNKFKKSMDNIEKLKKNFEKDMEKAQKEFGKAFQNLIVNADKVIKG